MVGIVSIRGVSLYPISRMGIDAYLHKSSSAEELLATIKAVSVAPGRGNAVISMPRGLLRKLGDEPASGLTERQAGTEHPALMPTPMPTRAT